MFVFLIFIAVLSGFIGFILIFKAFYVHTIVHPNKIKITSNQKKSIILEIIGICLLFSSSIIIIYFYSLQPQSVRIKNAIQKEKKELETVPDISYDYKGKDVKRK